MISFKHLLYFALDFCVYYKIKNTKQKLRAQKLFLILLVALIFILCIPVYVIVAFIIFITEGRPIFYKSKRHVSLLKVFQSLNLDQWLLMLHLLSMIYRIII